MAAARTSAAAAALVLGVLLSAPLPLQAQQPTVSVPFRVVAESGEAIPGALVRLLLDERQSPHRFTDDGGHVVLDVPLRVPFRVAVERFGYAPWESEPLRLEGAPAAALRLVVPLQPVQLDGIVVPRSDRCSRTRPLMVRAFGQLLGRQPQPRTPEEAARLVRMHDHVMGSLREIIAARPPGASYTQRVVERSPVLRSNGAVTGVTADTALMHAAALVPASDPDRLAERGYIEPVGSDTDTGFSVYHMLTPEVIVSESFTLTHCFQVAELPDSGWAGLAFEPLPGSSNYDVRGVVWLDTLHWRPVRIEFHYTRLAESLVESGEWAAAMRGASQRDMPHLQSQARRAREWENPRFARPVWLQARPTPDEKNFGGTLLFGADHGGAWDIVRWDLRWPGLAGRYTWGGYQPASRYGQQGIDLIFMVAARVLTLSRSVEVLGVRGAVLDDGAVHR
jgi:hypothetical protein